jgi:4-amino-4-deoxychorismate lyase
MQEWIWINGEPQTKVAVQNRGLAYGDGLFETLRISPRGPVLLEYHMDRLQESAPAPADTF